MPKTTKKNKLTREDIIKAGVKYIQKKSLESLSMRKIADEMGYGTMSLYNHIKDKNDLLDSMVDSSLAKIKYDDSDLDPKMKLKQLLINVHELMLKKIWVADLWQKTMPGVNRKKFMNHILKLLHEACFSQEAIYRGYCALTMHLVGFTQQEISYKRAMGNNMKEMATAFSMSLPEDHEYLKEHIFMRIERTLDDHDFEFILDLLINGLEER